MGVELDYLTGGIGLESSIITLYHGSIFDFDKIDITRGKPYKDFGAGFYTSKAREHAVDLALRNLKIEERRIKLHHTDTQSRAWLYEYEFDLSNLYDLRVMEFPFANADWVKFVVLNRTNKIPQHDYDIVMGATANDQTLLAAQAYLSGLYGTIDDERTIQTFLQIIEPYRLPAQFYFGTQQAADLLDFKGRSML